jgi:hypothetical protein
MTGCDFEECDGGAFRLAAALLPVAQGVHADLERARELFLAEADEAPEQDDVSTRLDPSLAYASPNRRRNHSSEIGFCQLADVEVVSHQ